MPDQVNEYINDQAICDQAPSGVVTGVATDPAQESRLQPQVDDKRKKRGSAYRKNAKVGFFRYCYYDPAFKFFAEQVLGAEFVLLPPPTKRTTELGAQYSTAYVCTPFKHMVGDYIESLELGANILVQVAGPCRLGYYGELQEIILHDMGYEFDMLNFSVNTERGFLGWARDCLDVFDSDINIPRALRKLVSVADMALKLDKAHDYYLANAGFELNRGDFKHAWDNFMEDMRGATTYREIERVYAAGMEAMEAIPIDKPEHPIRIGITGDMFTAIDERSNLDIDDKLIRMGVEVHRMMNITNRFIHYNEPKLRTRADGYVTYDMGPTSTITVVAALEYAKDGFDGVIHAKAAACTPEIDCIPVLQRISEEYHMPMLYLTYDSQTSDAGLETRLEAFYDMLEMKKRGNAE